MLLEPNILDGRGFGFFYSKYEVSFKFSSAPDELIDFVLFP